MKKKIKYFLTGGTGSFGKEFTNFLLKNYRDVDLTIYSRDEMKQWQMAIDYKNLKNINFIIGDVRDLDRLKWATKNMDHLIHAAATKIVPTAEHNPSECIMTNVDGARNVIEASRHNKIKNVLALSTDKACNPVNLYGATKLLSDKLFIAANDLTEKTKFSVVRYGNVIGSRGSIIPFFRSLKSNEPFPITDSRMTRFFITLNEAINLILYALGDMRGGEIYVKKTYSAKVIDIAKFIDPKRKHKIIGIRPGEKLHEEMISADDSRRTIILENRFVVTPVVSEWGYQPPKGSRMPEGMAYRSDTNELWISESEIKNFIKNL